MRRFHSPLFLTCLLLSVLRVSAGDAPLPEIFARITPSVVTLTAYSADGEKLGQEAGFVVEKSGVVATCFHVIADAASIEVQSPDETVRAATAVIFSDPDSDLALLRVDSLTAPPLKLCQPDAVRLDVPVAVIGSRLREATRYAQGVITSLLSPDGELNRIEFSVPISPGANGQPLVSNDTGTVVGMTAYRVRAGKKSAYAIPARIIAYRLRSIDQSAERALDDLPPEVKRQLAEEMDFRKVAAGECTEANTAMMDHGIQDALDGGFWISTHRTAVFRIYEGAAYKMLYNLEDQSAAVNSTLKTALKKAAAVEDGQNADQARCAILRNAFDSLFGIQGTRH